MKEFLKTTIVGGLLFLLPVALVLFILGYAVRAVTDVVQPISKSLGLDRLGGGIGGIGAVTAFAILLLVLVSFVAGIFARTGAGARITRWLEDKLLGNVPHYRLVKGMAQGLARVESTSSMQPALVSIDAGWQLGYLLEPLEHGWVAVFLPQAPSAHLGQRHVPCRRPRAPASHHHGAGHDAREQHRRRLGAGAARRRPWPALVGWVDPSEGWGKTQRKIE